MWNQYTGIVVVHLIYHWSFPAYVHAHKTSHFVRLDGSALKRTRGIEIGDRYLSHAQLIMSRRIHTTAETESSTAPTPRRWVPPTLKAQTRTALKTLRITGMRRTELGVVLLAALFPVASLASDAPFLPRGVDPVLAPRYDLSTGRAFSCLDGLKTIPADRVNDDFCDCADASDEPGVENFFAFIICCVLTLDAHTLPAQHPQREWSRSPSDGAWGSWSFGNTRYQELMYYVCSSNFRD